MAKIGCDIRLEIVGTKKSLILDEGEEFVIEFEKDEELREDFADVGDLINHFIENAFNRGDMIRLLIINNEDFVQNIIIKTLYEHGMNVEDALPEISSMPFICNADYSDICEMVNNILSSLKNDAEDHDHDDY